MRPLGNGGGGAGGGVVTAGVGAFFFPAVLNEIFRSTRVLAVVTLDPTAANDAADAVGNDAKLSVAAVALNACPAGAGAPLMVNDAMPELLTPEVDKKILYGL